MTARPDLETAKTAARLCRALYEFSGDPKENWDNIVELNHGLYVGIKKVSGKLFVVFRGTATFEDVLQDARFYMTFVRRVGGIYAGFHDDLPRFVPAIRRIAGQDDIVWCGHSRGAGEAKEAAVLYDIQFGHAHPLVLFGAPRVGDETFCEALAHFSRISFCNIEGSRYDPFIDLPPRIPFLLPYQDDTGLTFLNVKRAQNDPWPGEFALHHMQLYEGAVSQLVKLPGK